MAKLRKLGVESDKLMMETRWYPFVVVSAWIVAFGTVIKVFF